MTERRERLTKIKMVANTLKVGEKLTTKELSQQLKITERTIRRCINDLRHKHGVNIISDKKGHHYEAYYNLPTNLTITGKDIRELKLAIKTLNQFAHLPAFKGLAGLMSKIENSVKFNAVQYQDDIIFFEPVPFSAGTEYIERFLKAISDKKKVTFSYQSYHHEEIITHTFCPYFIQEYTNRWYVFGELELPHKKVICPFALDRILPEKDFKITEDSFSIYKYFDRTKHFAHSFGMTVYDKEPKVIILEFSSKQAKFFKSKPFHEYEVMSETEDKFIVRMKLIQNFELVRKLVSMGNGVKVIQPKELQNEVVKYHSDAVAQY